MFYFLHHQKKIIKMLSIYMILIFMCSPTWNMVIDKYQLGSTNAIELEEVLEYEIEDNSEKETSDNHKYNNRIQYSTEKEEVKQQTVFYDYRHLSTSNEVLTPPPEFI